MRNPATFVSILTAFVGGLMLVAPVAANAATPSATDIEQGKALAFNRDKGNCLACHMIPGGQQAGDIGPPLIAMKARFPDRQRLFNLIWDNRQTFPNSMMPPFGPNQILTKSQINKIIDFLYTH